MDSTAGAPPGTESSAGWPLLLSVLTALCVVHALLSGLLLLYGLATGDPAALGGGLAMLIWYIAILVGLLRGSDWARVSIVGLGYIGIVSYVGRVIFEYLRQPTPQMLLVAVVITLPAVAFEGLTILCGHSGSVRRFTKSKTGPREYIYRESASADHAQQRNTGDVPTVSPHNTSQQLEDRP